MSVLSTLLAPFKPQAPVDMGVWNAVRDDPARYWNWLVSVQAAGETVTMQNCLELSVVWSCVSQITNSVGSCAWNVYTLKRNRREVLLDDPLAYLLNVRPNPDMPAISMREALMFNVLTWGNAYAEIVRDGAGRVAQLWPLMSDQVMPRRRTTGELYYEYWSGSGTRTDLDASQVYHVRGPGLSGYMGDNVVARAAKAMSLTAAAERFASTYFGNNTLLGGFLEYPRALDDKTFKRLRESWEDRFRGPAKSNKPAILENGMKYTPITNNAEQAQMVPARKYQIEELCRFFNVPPHKVHHLDRMTYNNVEHISIEYVRDAVNPWCTRLEQEADYKLFAARSASRRTKIDTSFLMYGDSKSRAETHQIYRRIGVYSANDILVMEGKNTIGPEGDVRVVESNMQTLEQLLAAKTPKIEKYHVDAGIPDVNEVRVQLGLPPREGGDEPTAAPTKPAPAAPAQEPKEPNGAMDEAMQNLPLAVQASSEEIVRDCIATMFATALDRYAKRLEKREADLRRNATPKKVPSLMAAERERLRPWLLSECANALALAGRISGQQIPERVVIAAADKVDNGEAPLVAAERILKEAA